jgi:hypothetical protein
MPEIAAKLAVGDSLHADLFLHLHRVANTTIFNLALLRGGYLALLMFLPGLPQLGRAQQTTDVIGAKRRFFLFSHDSLSFRLFPFNVPGSKFKVELGILYFEQLAQRALNIER